MAPHSSTLAWKVPWTEEPGELQSMESLRVGYDWTTWLSCIGGGNGNPLQCSCLENPRDGGAWWAAVFGVAQSRTWLKRLSSSILETNNVKICIIENLVTKCSYSLGFNGDSAGKESTCIGRDLGLILGFEDPLEKGMLPLQYSVLENCKDSIVHGVERVRHNWATFTFCSLQ